MNFHLPIRRRRNERGYIMMTLLLIMSLMIIFAAVIVPSITFEIKRDREEEMIHRGVQYSRAIRAYYKKFGRYPAKIEDLQNTNQQRFLRKRYKDPLTNKDFRLLHFGEAKLALNGMPGGMIPGANPIGGNGSLNGGGGFSQTSPFGGNSAFGANSNSAFGQNSQTPNQTANQTTAAGDNNANPSGSDASQPGSDPAQPGSSGLGTPPNQTGPGSNSISGDKLSNTSFGGTPIVGVASFSKEPTIRIFDKKKKYNEWQFVYDPTMDRGLLITTPYQQQLQGFGNVGTPNLNGQINGQNGTNNGTNNNGFGNTFGNSPSGMQNNPNGGYGNPNQPTNPPQQQ
jgi:type II secretory pathway pseudopilin PulG